MSRYSNKPLDPDDPRFKWQVAILGVLVLLLVAVVVGGILI